MNGSFPINRSILLLVFAIPLALVIGVAVANPADATLLTFVAVAAGVLMIPLILKWHFAMVVGSWNVMIIVFFLPGNPPLWALAVAGGCVVIALEMLINRRRFENPAPQVVWALAVLASIVVVTMLARGGFGARSIGGSTYGGKKYFLMLFAIAGYFVFSQGRIAVPAVTKFMAWYFLGALSAAVGNVIYWLGPGAYWLFAIFPTETVVAQAAAETSFDMFSRLSGFGLAAIGPFAFMMGRYGLTGIFDLMRPWRLLIWTAAIVLSLLGGFRSVVAMFGLFFLIQFFLERVYQQKQFLVIIVLAVVFSSGMILTARNLPLPVQRALSILPIEIDPAARTNAQASTEWRLRMWRVLIADLPKYLVLGKGFAIDPAELYLAQESMLRGLAEDFEVSLIAGDYHSGPLGLLISFGIPGMAAFVWFVIAAGRYLYFWYRRGDPRLRTWNTMLFSFFVCRVVHFFFVFGEIASGMAVFVGIIGLSVAINGRLRTGERGRAESPAPMPNAAPAAG